MGLFSFNKNKRQLKWNNISTENELHHFLNKVEQPVVFFKHSTRCSISSMALNRLESEWNLDESACTLVFIDVIASRPISNLLSEITGIEHQSPQLILWKSGEVLYTASHSEIRFETIASLI